MRLLGDDVHLQRGETWSLDFEVSNGKGDPLMISNQWRHPYLAITVTAARYEQKGDYRHTWWLDLASRWEEQQDGSVLLVSIKKFIATEALPLTSFSVGEAIATYGIAAGGKIVLDENSDFDVKNYLFYIDPLDDGNRVYKYVDSYSKSGDDLTDESWHDYGFRIIHAFNTKDWVEQRYLYDIKVLTGQTVEDAIEEILAAQDTEFPPQPWSDEKTLELISLIKDEQKRTYMLDIYLSNAPIMPDWEVKSIELEPTNIYVSANIQGGINV